MKLIIKFTEGIWSVANRIVTVNIADIINWILTGGVWNDQGVWIDSETWNDGE